jgi:hypothetical protein
MSNKLTLSWPDRFAVIDHYKPSDDRVCSVFGITPDELLIARQLRAHGTIMVNDALDVQRYANVFDQDTSPSTRPTSTLVQPNAIRPTAAPTRPAGGSTTYVKPESATKRPKEPQKRGRKGDKIARALASVPTSQVPVDQFIRQHDVSLAVLRQSKRFLDALPVEQRRAIGKINVRQDKSSKVLMIWRETE